MAAQTMGMIAKALDRVGASWGRPAVKMVVGHGANAETNSSLVNGSRMDTPAHGVEKQFGCHWLRRVWESTSAFNESPACETPKTRRVVGIFSQVDGGYSAS